VAKFHVNQLMELGDLVAKKDKKINISSKTEDHRKLLFHAA